MRSSFIALGLSLGLVTNLVAQTEAETQRATLTGLRSFAVYARVQLSQSATLQRIDERVLRNKIEDALRREGIRVQTRNDMRDGSQASLDLLYMVIQTKDTSGHALGFAASSCLQASQMVRIPRLTTPKHIAYAVVSTWRSCGLLVGDSASLGSTILQNADEHIIRFIDAWRFANTPPPEPRFPATSELSMAGRQYRRWRDNGTLGQESAQAFGFGVGSSAAVPLGAFLVPAPAAVRRSLAVPASRPSPAGVSPLPDPTPGDGRRCLGPRRRGCGL
jgi:hypothetical protein